MKAKDYLNRYIEATLEIKALESDARRIRETVQDASAKYGEGGGSAPNPDKIPIAIERIYAITQKIENRVKELEAIREEISEVINKVDDSRLRSVLRMRYIGGDGFRAIADCLGCQEQNVVRFLHPKALEAVEKILEHYTNFH